MRTSDKMLETFYTVLLHPNKEAFAAFRESYLEYLHEKRHEGDALIMQKELLQAFVKIEALIEKNSAIEERVQQFQEGLQAAKWNRLPLEEKAHELALNPNFSFSPSKGHEEKERRCQKALSNHDYAQIASLLSEVRERLIALDPENEEFVRPLREFLDTRMLKEKMSEDALGTFEFLFCFLMEKMKEVSLYAS